MRHIKHPFGAVIDKNCKALILGSVPSVKSVEGSFYYMHPQNRFWKVLSALLNEELFCADIDTRKTVLIKHNIALYDSVEECDILGSSDSKISGIIAADIPALMRGTSINHIFCNGTASYNYLVKAHPDLESITIKLPSTSPANAAFSLDKLVQEWSIIIPYLQ